MHAGALGLMQAGALSFMKNRWLRRQSSAATGPSWHACRVSSDLPPPQTRRARLWRAAESSSVPLRAILVAVAVVVLAILAARIIDRLRGVILLLVVAGFIA